jgi:hypothetical protein
MALKFTLEKGEVVLDKNIVLLQEFSDITNYGIKKKNPKHARRLLLYVFFCCDLTEENALKDLDFRIKPEQAKARALGRDYKFTKEENDLIGAAMDAYNFFNETAPERADLAMDKKIDEARSLLDETKPIIITNVNATTGATTFVSNGKIITEFAEQIDTLMTLKLKMKQTAMKITNTSRVKGNKGSSLIERGTLAKMAGEMMDNTGEEEEPGEEM